MKKLTRTPALLAAALVFLYLGGLLLGMYAVGASPIYYKQKNYFTTQAQTIAREYLEGTETTLEHMKGFNLRILIYDTGGNCLRHTLPTNADSPLEPGVDLEKYLPAVLSGKEVFRPAFAQETQREISDIMIVVGVPMVDQGAVVGAVFLVKNLMDLPEAIVGYVLYFTLFYWLSAYFVVSNIRKNRKLEELRQNYVANVTHAFKTPIASIKALAETLCDGVEPDQNQQKVYYGMILQEANRQDHMVRDVLELSKLQSSGMDFSRTTLDARTVIDPILEKYAALGDCMGVALHPSQALSVLPPLYSNASCLKQLFEILLDNALKFVSEGGEVWVEVSLRKNRAVFCVRDNGVGIAPEALPHVFERFFKGSHDFNESGSGLGLAIAREIAAGLKEKLWVESEPGKGSAFFFTMRVK
jgi:signal transduction histidine kinase